MKAFRRIAKEHSVQFSRYMENIYAPLAQLVEQLTLNQWVPGSSPCRRTIVGIDCHEGPPVPIPNTEVKLMYADNTWRVTAREDR